MIDGIVCYNVLPEPRIKTTQHQRLKFETEIYVEGELNDTKVIYCSDSGEYTLCWIAGTDIEAFTESFYSVIKKYAI